LAADSIFRASGAAKVAPKRMTIFPLISPRFLSQFLTVWTWHPVRFASSFWDQPINLRNLFKCPDVGIARTFTMPTRQLMSVPSVLT